MVRKDVLLVVKLEDSEAGEAIALVSFVRRH